MDKNFLLLIIYILLLAGLPFCSPGDDKNDQTRDAAQSSISDTAKNRKPSYDIEKGVINFFCGRGCIPCDKVTPVVKAIAEKYKFRHVTYEVWYDDGNRELLLKMAKERNTVVSGVPVVIIENDVYMGVEKITRLEELIREYKK